MLAAFNREIAEVAAGNVISLFNSDIAIKTKISQSVAQTETDLQILPVVVNKKEYQTLSEKSIAQKGDFKTAE